MPLPLSDAGLYQPRAGYVYVERDEQPETFGGGFIIIPDSTRKKVKSSTGTVRAVGAGVPVVQPGDRVMLSQGVGARLVFGEREERTLYVLEPAQLIALILEESRIEETGPDAPAPERFAAPTPRAEHAQEGRADEGVSKGAPK